MNPLQAYFHNCCTALYTTPRGLSTLEGASACWIEGGKFSTSQDDILQLLPSGLNFRYSARHGLEAYNMGSGWLPATPAQVYPRIASEFGVIAAAHRLRVDPHALQGHILDASRRATRDLALGLGALTPPQWKLLELARQHRPLSGPRLVSLGGSSWVCGKETFSFLTAERTNSPHGVYSPSRLLGAFATVEQIAQVLWGVNTPAPATHLQFQALPGGGSQASWMDYPVLQINPPVSLPSPASASLEDALLSISPAAQQQQHPSTLLLYWSADCQLHLDLEKGSLTGGWGEKLLSSAEIYAWVSHLLHHPCSSPHTRGLLQRWVAERQLLSIPEPSSFASLSERA